MKKICFLATLCITSFTSLLANPILFERNAVAIATKYFDIDPKNVNISEVKVDYQTDTINIEFFSPITFADFSFYQLSKCTLDRKTGQIISSNLGINGYTNELETPINPVTIKLDDNEYASWETLTQLTDKLNIYLEGMEWDDLINSLYDNLDSFDNDLERLTYNFQEDHSAMLLNEINADDWSDLLTIVEDNIEVFIQETKRNVLNKVYLGGDLLNAFELELEYAANEWLDNWKDEWGSKLDFNFHSKWDFDIDWNNITNKLKEGWDSLSETWDDGLNEATETWQSFINSFDF
ncbi:MAG: hypothetical protein ATN31_11055 [Candidatus Epulonipiscioides saccharophilum]|nr:MAG: hypothetical protein ATN31_11055 [Epulopiscium sp. AS2M-Bin001]